jgi:hypothetical protein
MPAIPVAVTSQNPVRWFRSVASGSAGPGERLLFDHDAVEWLDRFDPTDARSLPPPATWSEPTFS